jgi:hypothetical protein
MSWVTKTIVLRLPTRSASRETLNARLRGGALAQGWRLPRLGEQFSADDHRRLAALGLANELNQGVLAYLIERVVDEARALEFRRPE